VTKVKKLTDKDIVHLKKAGITGRDQNPRLCFVYFFLSFLHSLDDKIFCRFSIEECFWWANLAGTGYRSRTEGNREAMNMPQNP